MKNCLFSLFLFLSVGVYAQIPVTDVAMNTNTTVNQIVNAATWSEQLLNLQQQAAILTKTLSFVTDVSSVIRDAAYAKSLLERQQYIITTCSDLIKRADKVDVNLARGISGNVSSFLATNNSLITLLTNTLTSRFKMNDSERLQSLLNIKKEQDALLENIHTTDMILSTTTATTEILEFQLFK